MNLPDAIERVRPTFVFIRLENAILGTGFFTDEEAHVITAKHVIDGGRNFAKANGIQPDFSAGMATPNMENASFPGAQGITIVRNFNIVGCDVVAEDSINDLALLRLRATRLRERYR